MRERERERERGEGGGGAIQSEREREREGGGVGGGHYAVNFPPGIFMTPVYTLSRCAPPPAVGFMVKCEDPRPHAWSMCNIGVPHYNGVPHRVTYPHLGVEGVGLEVQGLGLKV